MKKINVIEEELTAFPMLKSLLEKDEGYRLPENYFSGLDKKYDILLDNDVPEGYFDQVEQDILQKASIIKEKSKVRNMPWRWMSGIAAGMVVLIAINFSFFNTTDSSADSELTADWDSYLDDNLEYYSMSDFLDEDMYYETNWESIDDEALEDFIDSNLENYDLSTVQEYFND